MCRLFIKARLEYNANLDQYRVKVIRRIFFSEDSGFGVFTAHFSKNGDRLVIAGLLAGVEAGDQLDIEGEEVFHPRFGRQVKVHSFCHFIPTDLDGLKAFLGSGRFKGVGVKTAQKLIDGFGRELPEILEKDPSRLSEIRGISKKVAQTVGDSYQALRDQRELMIKLTPYGIGQETLNRIIAVYANQAMDILSSNPYRVMSEVKGVGFKSADAIARAMGFEKNHPLRIQSALLWLIEQLEQRQGDLFFPLSDFLLRAQRQFDMQEALLREHLQRLISRGLLIRIDRPIEGISRPGSYWAEKAIAVKLHQMMAHPASLAHILPDGNFCDETGRLTENQVKSVVLAFESAIEIITGGPGTGKTTVIKEIVKRCLNYNISVAVVAPTGRAAKRIEESSGYAASTIHRLLKIDPESGSFIHHEGNPLGFQMVIVDEFSMVDVFLFLALLKAITPGTHLVLIGDKDQLPSVGPGNVIRDLIGSHLFPISVLTHNFRQEQAAPLIYLAETVQSGRADLFIKACEHEDERFRFLRADTGSEAQRLILKEMALIFERLPVSSLEYQVLSPMYRGEAGVELLNQKIQEQFNHRDVVVDFSGRHFRVGDRVMQLRNNYQLEIFNGEQGIVCGYESQRRLLKVDFGERTLELSHEQMDDIILSYASTVHKAQGAEFREVILCLLPSHGIMLNRELFYTALTRARQRVVLVGNCQALTQAISQAVPRFRKTLLSEHLKDFDRGEQV